MTYIKGKYRKSIYQSDAGYTIGIVKILETDDDSLNEYVDRTITFTGYFHELSDIDTYIFYGKLINHEKYGEQYEVSSYERCQKEEKNAIIEFLTSGLFKGIGEAKAEKIVGVLGKDTLKVILENPANLILIPGITETNAKMLHDKLLEYESSYEAILYLNDLGFSTKDSMKIYNYYKSDTIKIIDKNIYKVTTAIKDLTFKKVDAIALKMNLERDDIRRVEASILYIMNEVSNTYGHSYFYKDEVKGYIPRVLGVSTSDDDFDSALSSLINDISIINIEDKYYLKEMYEAESLIVKRFNILNNNLDKKVKNIDNSITDLEGYYGITYNKCQKEAIKSAIEKDFLIITGGPGTGKTTIMKAIVELFKQSNKLNTEKLASKMALLAPTGRAAKRMGEGSLLGASTIHRFLKWNMDTDTYTVNEYNKSLIEFVVIDEASMIDTYLLSNLLKGLSVNTKIILIGDYDQLPSVGPGEVLKDLINSNKLNVCRLDELYRQEKDSSIINLAYNIRDGKLDESIFNKNPDLTFIECEQNEVISHIEEISSSYSDLLYRDFQVLAPMYKTICGIDNINKRLQTVFNPKNKAKNEIVVDDFTYRVDDKVLQLTNMPDENVYNGDIGRIVKISTKPKKEIYIDFDSNIVKYTPAKFNFFKSAYAISIHKAQGSEFDVVVIPVVKTFNKMLYRKLIYTAVTRCKKKLYLVGDVSALKYAIKNNNSDVRRTSIKEFLEFGIK